MQDKMLSFWTNEAHSCGGGQQTVKRSVGAKRLCQPGIAGAYTCNMGLLNSYISKKNKKKPQE